MATTTARRRSMQRMVELKWLQPNSAWVWGWFHLLLLVLPVVALTADHSRRFVKTAAGEASRSATNSHQFAKRLGVRQSSGAWCDVRWAARSKSGGGPPHSKTLARWRTLRLVRPARAQRCVNLRAAVTGSSAKRTRGTAARGLSQNETLYCPETGHFSVNPLQKPVRGLSHPVRSQSWPVRSQSHLVRSRPVSIRWTRHPVRSRSQPVRERPRRLGMRSYGLGTASCGMGKTSGEVVTRAYRVVPPQDEETLASYPPPADGYAPVRSRIS